MAKLENWRIEERAHDLKDVTQSRFAVVADGILPGSEGMRPIYVEIADWLSHDTACLIAAAPELLESLFEMVRAADKQSSDADEGNIRDWDADPVLSEIINRAGVVIAKANGELE